MVGGGVKSFSCQTQPLCCVGVGVLTIRPLLKIGTSGRRLASQLTMAFVALPFLTEGIARIKKLAKVERSAQNLRVNTFPGQSL